MKTIQTNINLAKIIESPVARKWVYSGYGVALLANGAVSSAYLALEQGFPAWLVASTAILSFLGIPVSGLALTNTPPANTVVEVSDEKATVATSAEDKAAKILEG